MLVWSTMDTIVAIQNSNIKHLSSVVASLVAGDGPTGYLKGPNSKRGLGCPSALVQICPRLYLFDSLK